MNGEFEIKKEIVACGKRMYEKDLVAATDGNISVRLSPDRVLITPTGSCLGDLATADLVVIDLDGKTVGGEGKPTSEFRLHLEVYRRRDDVRAIVHAHPPLCTAFSVAGVSLENYILPEIAFTIGAIPTTPYSTPTTDEPPRAVAEYISDCDAMILDRHGALTVGETLREAYNRMEKLEHTAKVVLAAHSLGRVKTLEPDQVDRLLRAREALGLHGKLYRCVYRPGDAAPTLVDDREGLIGLIASEVIRSLRSP
ncbi:MAG TPA: class II aldolase/adducin family protein [bacterium]|nr:class II aldolase/adducin family protein [bacterium]HPQ66262.1 class II aldolase/adducin family protein [bacterium]